MREGRTRPGALPRGDDARAPGMRRGAGGCASAWPTGRCARKEVESCSGKRSRAAIRPVARPRARAAVGDVGAPPRRPLRRPPRTWLGRRRTVTREAGLELLVRRYLGGFGPAAPRGDRGLGRPAARGVGARAGRAWRCAAFRAEDGRRAGRPAARCRCRTPTRRRRCASCRPGTRRCSCTPAARRSCPRSTGRGSSTPDAAVGADVPGRRRRGGHVAVRGRRGAHRAVRAPRRARPASATRGGRAPGRVLRLDRRPS